MLKKSILFCVILSGFFLQTVSAQINARMFRFPDVSENKIVFTYGGDLWVVDKDGGTANRLSSPAGTENMARFSPDGQQIAFTGNYGGNRDVYVISTGGGVPERVTSHGGSDLLLDWHPKENKLLFSSARKSGRQRYRQLYTVSLDGGLPMKVAVSYGDLACFSPDGKKIAFNFNSRIYRTWKRYRGGMAPDIHVFDTEAKKSWNISNTDANEEFPMWVGENIYYLSDRGEAKRFNIWMYNVSTKEHKQLTHFKDFDVHFPSAGPSDIVFEAGGKLYLLDINSKEHKEVDVSVVTDQTSLLPQQKNPSKQIEWAQVSPAGKRIVAEARGEIFSIPAEKGVTHNLTQTSGVAERYPVWAPNGEKVAWWSDKSGEYQLCLHDFQSGETNTLTDFKKGFRYPVYWSPDSKKMAYVNHLMELFIYDTEKQDNKKIDTGNGANHHGLLNFSFDWSPDSKWLTWSRSVNQNNSVVFIYDVDAGKKHQVTSDFYTNYRPAFDPEGKYLYCLTNREMRPVYSEFDGTFVYPNSTMVAAIPLTTKIESPLKPENDEVKIEGDEDVNEDEKKKKKDKEKDKDESVKIDFEGFERRMILLPVDAGRYSDLSAIEGKVVFMRHPNAGSNEKRSAVQFYDLKEREVKTIIKGVQGFEITADQKKMMVMARNKIGVIDIAPKQKLEEPADLGNMIMTVNPREEWRQMFWDAWRLERDFFYDENMHGVDWKAIGEQYAKLIDQAVTRSDVNYVLGELIGEMNASHAYVGGGDREQSKYKRIGYLGVDWAVDNGQYKIKRIVRGAPWDAEVRSPLDEPGVDISEGDYVLAVNGVALDLNKQPYAAFEDMAGETVELTVNDKPTTDGARKVVVKTLKSESRLRHLAWIEQNRKQVDEATNGRAGYIYVRSTGIDGQNELVRQFAAQYHKDALVIDERFNSGGQIPDRFIELLDREPLAYWAVRGKKDWQWPRVANFGPKVMLINGWSGSGGDAFPDYFRKAGLGKLVGTRTWGGLIGISGAPGLIDGGVVTVPTFRMYNPDGTWFKEGHGVEPDIKVPENPAELAKGKDAQLEKAIEVILEELKQYEPVKGHAPYETR